MAVILMEASEDAASEPSAFSLRSSGSRQFDDNDEADRREHDSQEAGSGKGSVVLQRICPVRDHLRGYFLFVPGTAQRFTVNWNHVRSMLPVL